MSEPDLSATIPPVLLITEGDNPPNSGVNTHLSADLRADFEALENDFEQACALTIDLQSQLSGKSNEFAQHKHLFEKNTRNLEQLQTDISELREERHRLANEAMRATALEFTLEQTVKERDQLKLDLENLSREHHEQVAKLTASRQTANERPSGFASVNRVPHPRAATILSDITKSLDQLREIIEIREKPPSQKLQPEPEFIDISFSK